VLDNLVLELMEKETLSRDQVLQIFAPVVVKEKRPSYSGYGKRLPSNRPPILSRKEQSGNGALPAGEQVAGGNGALPAGTGHPEASPKDVN
jgi:cell division protease FtsH